MGQGRRKGRFVAFDGKRAIVIILRYSRGNRSGSRSLSANKFKIERY